MTKDFGRVVVVGLGYIGLPTAAILADHGVCTIGVDVSQSVVNSVNRGEVPFVEPGLREVLKRAVEAGKLSATNETPSADAFIVAVPTPFTENRKADLTYIDAAAKSVAPKLQGGELVILESTSPPGTTERLRDVLLAERPDLSAEDVHVAHCPERVLPGKIMHEMLTNDRIIGGISPKAAVAARELYRSFCSGELLLTNARTAELAKLTENSFRDVNIAFANELSLICDKLEVDPWELIELANHHPRVNILQPGPGVGGHCIAVDPWFIVEAAPEESRLIRTARETNDAKPEWVLGRIEQAIEDHDGDATVGLFGLTFKPNIDDLRESPALHILESLAQRHPTTQILAVEPHIEALPAALAAKRNVTLTPTEDALSTAHIGVLLVDHDVFKTVTRTQLGGTKVIDTRGIWQ